MSKTVSNPWSEGRRPKLLRPLDVVSDVRDVNTGAGDLEPVVDLHGLDLDDPASRQPGEHDVLCELRVWSGRRTDRRGCAVFKVKRREIQLLARDPPLADGQVEYRAGSLDLAPHPSDEIGKGDRLELHQPADPAFARDFGTDGAAAGASLMGRSNRRSPSKACRAPATAPAVGTRPISPTPFEP